MKQVSWVATYSVLSVLLLSGGVASALDSGSITNTGPGSNNEITFNNDCTTTVVNDTDIGIGNGSEQGAESGDATSSDNTSAGGASSGSAINSNDTLVDVVIDNSSDPGCEAQTTVTPGSGGGKIEGVSTAAVGGVAAATQVQAPVGGVGAGEGGISSSLFAVSVLSSALGLYRLRSLKLVKEIVE